jgi:hypothetical protein
MSVAIRYPHIVKPDATPAHLERVPRVSVSMIVKDYLFYGWSIEEMCRQHPYLKPAEAHSAMAYYFDHKDEIEAEILADSELVQSTQFKPSPFVTRMRSLGKL